MTVRKPTAPKFKDIFLSFYLSPYRLMEEDKQNLLTRFDPAHVEMLAEAMEKDFLSSDDIARLNDAGLTFGKYHSKHWQYPWVTWAAHVINTPWFLNQLPLEAQKNILITLGELDEEGISVPSLSQFLFRTPQRPDLCVEAMLSLGKIGPPSRIAIPQMIRTMEESFSPDVVHRGVWALGCLKEDAALSVPFLIERLRQRDCGFVCGGTTIRQEIINTLSRFFLFAPEPVLEGLADARTRADVKEAVSKALHACMLPLVAKCLASPTLSHLARLMMENVMEEKFGKSVVAQLLKLVDEEAAKETRLAALRALAQMGTRGKKAIYSLSQKIVDENTDLDLREAMVAALSEMGGIGKRVMMAIEPKIQNAILRSSLLECLSSEVEYVSAGIEDLLKQTPRKVRSQVFPLQEGAWLPSGLPQLA